MKSLWTIITILALANVLAIGGFVAWLAGTDRLNAARVERLREMFSTTVAADAALAATAEAATIQQVADTAAAEKMAIPPEAAATIIERQEQADQVKLQHLLRRQREVEDLQRSLDRERARLTTDQARLLADRAQFEDYRARLASTEGGVQFKKALETLQTQKPKDAKDVLKAMLSDQKAEEVVGYLSAMDDRARTKIIAEFVKEDSTLAADLLERLRTRGTVAPAPGTGTVASAGPTSE